MASSADRTVKMRKKGEQNMDRLNKRDSEGSYGRREHGSRTVRERARKVSVLGQRYDIRGVKFLFRSQNFENRFELFRKS